MVSITVLMSPAWYPRRFNVVMNLGGLPLGLGEGCPFFHLGKWSVGGFIYIINEIR